jgi:hypothetical protein
VLLSKEIENVSLLKHLIESRLDVKRIAFDPSFGHSVRRVELLPKMESNWRTSVVAATDHERGTAHED